MVGPARTFSPLNLWDLRLRGGHRVALDLPADWTTGLFLLRGEIRWDEGQGIGAAELAVLERAGSRLEFDVIQDATLLLLNGQPLDEPIAGQGPFVMNSPEEIVQAFEDYHSGRFGHLGRP